MNNAGQVLKNGSIQAVLVLNAFIMVYPLIVMVMSSFKTNAEIFTSPFALPHSFSLANAEKVWTKMAQKAGRGDLVLGNRKVTLDQVRQEFERAVTILAQAVVPLARPQLTSHTAPNKLLLAAITRR